MSDFTKLKIGDCLYSMRFGPVIVKELTPFDMKNQPILCVFQARAGYAEWTRDGKLRQGDENPDLYWSKPIFTEPPPPEERISREIVYEGWWVCFKKRLRGPFATQEDAQAVNTGTITPIYAKIPLTILVATADEPLPE